eukprot:CAMPEP_0181359536 /NCGR_PEP_ID=MMETSP1106-20121128/6144_1 /TAXON_ID=81844 /ORGANISM="Mantoniella antarctica, Strain SL-175" /LENGTH=164 /DNA_ID=CAMNT_0023472667 /DNA_START=180 /DNA_END=670 /DNA_ORIENTATION=+
MDDKVAEVCGIAGCTDAQARFFLESAAGDVAGAVTAYFEHGDGGGEDVEEEPAPAAPAAPATTPAAAPRAPAAAAAPKRRATGGVSNVRGLSDMRDDEDENGDDEKPTEWYTGGAASGQMVQDPKKPKSNQDRVEDMLQGARDSGAVQGSAEDLENPGGGGGGG